MLKNMFTYILKHFDVAAYHYYVKLLHPQPQLYTEHAFLHACGALTGCEFLFFKLLYLCLSFLPFGVQQLLLSTAQHSTVLKSVQHVHIKMSLCLCQNNVPADLHTIMHCLWTCNLLQSTSPFQINLGPFAGRKCESVMQRGQ